VIGPTGFTGFTGSGFTTISGGVATTNVLTANGANAAIGQTNVTYDSTSNILAITGSLSAQQIQETLNTITSPSGTVVANWATGDIWIVTSLTANFTINLTNLPTTTGKVYSVVFILVQGASPWYISALQIAGSAQTIKWFGASAPTPTASRVEAQSFTMVYNGSWTVLGQLSSFG
jgi:hypothetical protein